MIAYLDSSVLLRWVLGEKGKLKDPTRFSRLVSSEIIRVECMRTLDRLRVTQPLEDKDVAKISEAIHRIVEQTDLVLLSRPILNRAAQPFPTAVGTLDAIHLASAQLWSQSEAIEPLILTHDLQLARACQALGYRVEGC